MVQGKGGTGLEGGREKVAEGVKRPQNRREEGGGQVMKLMAQPGYWSCGPLPTRVAVAAGPPACLPNIPLPRCQHLDGQLIAEGIGHGCQSVPSRAQTATMPSFREGAGELRRQRLPLCPSITQQIPLPSPHYDATAALCY